MENVHVVLVASFHDKAVKHAPFQLDARRCSNANLLELLLLADDDISGLSKAVRADHERKKRTSFRHRPNFKP